MAHVPTSMSKYPRIPRILGQSWECPGMAHMHQSKYPPKSIPRLLGQSWDYSGWSKCRPLTSKYPGFPGYLEFPGIVRMAHMHADPHIRSIPGFPGYSDNPGIIPSATYRIPGFPGWPMWTTRIPRILGQSWDHPRMAPVLTPTTSKYPKIPRIPDNPKDYPRMA